MKSARTLQRPVLLVIVVATVAVIQLGGIYAWGAVVGNSDVEVKSYGASCHFADLSPVVPLQGIETRQFEAGWSWAPPGLTCRTMLGGESVLVRSPTWSVMAVPVLALFAAILVTAVLVGAGVRILAPGRRYRVPVACGLAGLFAQPVSAATVLAALALPSVV